MEYPELPIEVRAMEALGLGFDLASDFRLKFAKGCPGGGRLVVLDEGSKRDIVVPGGFTIRGVSEDIRCDKGDRIRFKSDVLDFNQMSELLNQKSSVQGKVPSGYLNAIFDLTGAWLTDAGDAKYLAFDGYFISLYYLHLTASPLVLHDKVKKSVPSHWNPASLSRFIQTYGTHIIVGMAIGGQDLLLCKTKKPSSVTIPPAELRGYLEDLGDCLFSDRMSPPLLEKTRGGKQKVPDVFKRMLQSPTMQFTTITETSSKDGLTLIWSKRGGDVFSYSHSKWLQTVAANPDAILFKFVPITSLLTGVPGSGYLSHAINLYLRYKPALEDLQYFLEFQVPRQWAPMFCELPLRHQRRKGSCPTLQFRFLGPKMHISSTQIQEASSKVMTSKTKLEARVEELPSFFGSPPRGDHMAVEGQWMDEKPLRCRIKEVNSPVFRHEALHLLSCPPSVNRSIYRLSGSSQTSLPTLGRSTDRCAGVMYMPSPDKNATVVDLLTTLRGLREACNKKRYDIGVKGVSDVSTGQKPVIGLRLYLEGKKSNRLAIHVEHLSSVPNIMAFTSADSSTCRPCQWRGSNDYELSNQFLEPVNWKRYSKVCSSVVQHNPNWIQGEKPGVFVVTGAQLISKGKWPKTVLHIRLLFTHLPNCTIRKTEWTSAPAACRKGSLLVNLSTTFTFTQRTDDPPKQLPSALNSGVYPEGPPVPVRSGKLLKYVDTAEVVRGPHDAPGHWLVTAAKLVTEDAKIGLHVKFALLDYEAQEP
ncbi:MAC/Perforin domain-containing protein [Actinidia rufa]|uniref:MAC/Perforin domain-containing protein n=1 Tax=Actinidia rufa TaxID=165716 RepID=A0A7J0E4S8_9ERIC|nr:MAC/Perforin domain-containing protein [Actinidia rufa]